MFPAPCCKGRYSRSSVGAAAFPCQPAALCSSCCCWGSKAVSVCHLPPPAPSFQPRVPKGLERSLESWGQIINVSIRRRPENPGWEQGAQLGLALSKSSPAAFCSFGELQALPCSRREGLCAVQEQQKGVWGFFSKQNKIKVMGN